MFRHLRRGARGRFAIALAALSLLSLGASAVSISAGASSTLTPPTAGMTPQTSIGKGEGKLSLIAWEGYAPAAVG